MAKQEYILKKYVKAENALEAAKLDGETPVSEVFLVQDRPKEEHTSAVGFQFLPPPGDF